MNERHPDEARLNAYLLDELSAAEHQEVHAHVQDCPTCRRLTDTLRQVLVAYRDDSPAAADENGLARLLTVRRFTTPRRSRRAVAGLAAASAAVIFLGGFWMGRSDVLRPGRAPTGAVPATVETSPRPRHGHEHPVVTFAAADADLMGGYAPRDTSWN